MILLYALPAPKVSNADCEAEILAEVERMKEELIPDDEVEKIKARAKANFINGLSSNSGIGFQLAAYQNYWGDWREMFNELNRINAVTAEDIKRVANTYLTSKNRTVIMMNTVES